MVGTRPTCIQWLPHPWPTQSFKQKSNSTILDFNWHNLCVLSSSQLLSVTDISEVKYFYTSVSFVFSWQWVNWENRPAADEDVPALPGYRCWRWDWSWDSAHTLGCHPCMRHHGGRCHSLRIQQHHPHDTTHLHRRQPGAWFLLRMVYECLCNRILLCLSKCGVRFYSFALYVSQFPLNKLTELLRQDLAAAGFTEALNFALVRKTHKDEPVQHFSLRWSMHLLKEEPLSLKPENLNS